MEFSKTSMSLLFLFILFSSSYLTSRMTHLQRTTTFPPNQRAERLIRSLNLFPKDTVNIIHNHSFDFVPGKIVEKKFSFFGENLGHHVGYYSLPRSKAARMFYFFFKSRNSTNDDPVVIWLAGGPGCSSELAIFYENGPFQIANNLSIVWSEYGWDKASNIIFVDQPIGTGFSYTSDDSDIPHDESGVSNDLYDFLQGFAIGNGMTNPIIQYSAYTQYAFDMKLITKEDQDNINKLLRPCEDATKICESGGDRESCSLAFDHCEDIVNRILIIAGNINFFDIRKTCEGSLCYDFSNVETLLNEKIVRDALGVGELKFDICSKVVYEAMHQDWMRNLEVDIPSLLEDGIKVLIYAGEFDLICNWLGNSNWVHAIEWSRQNQFATSKTLQFSVDGVEAGLLKSYGPLSFLKVNAAGHMVPMDQPKVALQMLVKWMQGKLNETSI
ncbi:unnamed protein product [Lathyrus oleraceus]